MNKKVKRSGAKSRYQQLAEILIKKIAAGTYPIGNKLPTEFELSREYNLSRHTVREASELKELSLVSRRQGSGSVVIAQRSATPIYTHSMRSLQDVVQHAREAKLAVLSVELISADPWLSQLLNCSLGKRWLKIEGIRVVAGQPEPISWTEIYVDARYKGIRRFIRNAPRAISALVQDKYGAPIHMVHQKIESISVPKNVSKHLKTTTGVPALLLTRNYKNANNETIIFSINIHPGDRYVYSMEIVRT